MRGTPIQCMSCRPFGLMLTYRSDVWQACLLRHVRAYPYAAPTECIGLPYPRVGITVQLYPRVGKSTLLTPLPESRPDSGRFGAATRAGSPSIMSNETTWCTTEALRVEPGWNRTARARYHASSNLSLITYHLQRPGVSFTPIVMSRRRREPGM